MENFYNRFCFLGVEPSHVVPGVRPTALPAASPTVFGLEDDTSSVSSERYLCGIRLGGFGGFHHIMGHHRSAPATRSSCRSNNSNTRGAGGAGVGGGAGRELCPEPRRTGSTSSIGGHIRGGGNDGVRLLPSPLMSSPLIFFPLLSSYVLCLPFLFSFILSSSLVFSPPLPFSPSRLLSSLRILPLLGREAR